MSAAWGAVGLGGGEGCRSAKVVRDVGGAPLPRLVQHPVRLLGLAGQLREELTPGARPPDQEQAPTGRTQPLDAALADIRRDLQLPQGS